MEQPKPESEYATIRDVRDRLNDLVEWGLGDHPVQVLVVPDSTLQSVARVTGGEGYDRKKPALMLEMGSPSGRMPVSILTTDRMSGRHEGMPSLAKQ